MKKSSSKLSLLACVVAISTLSGCATQSSSPDVVSRNQAQNYQSIVTGRIESVRNVTIEGSQSGIGATAGALTGAVAGSSVKGRDGIVLGIIGAVIGGVAGNAIEKGTTSDQAVEMIITLDTGKRIALVQSQGAQGLVAGDYVNVIGNPGSYRVSRNTTGR